MLTQLPLVKAGEHTPPAHAPTRVPQRRRSPEELWEAFRDCVARSNGVVLETRWLGRSTPHRVRCHEGHENETRPDSLFKGQGLCRTCAGQDPTVAQEAFRTRVKELGGIVVEPAWLGARTKHRVRCLVGHEGSVYPANVQQGGGICYICGRGDPAECWRRFRARVEELGGTVLDTYWLGDATPHRVRCHEGHDTTLWPSGVRKGGGICRVCAGQAWDAFYVVADDNASYVKVGITSGDPRPRLRGHARRGFTRVVRLLTDLPNDTAPTLERDVLATLRLAREKPVRGREYFDVRVLATVLDIVDHYPLPIPIRPA